MSKPHAARTLKAQRSRAVRSVQVKRGLSKPEAERWVDEQQLIEEYQPLSRWRDVNGNWQFVPKKTSQRKKKLTREEIETARASVPAIEDQIIAVKQQLQILKNDYRRMMAMARLQLPADPAVSPAPAQGYGFMAY
jgi:hypothetical protein